MEAELDGSFERAQLELLGFDLDLTPLTLLVAPLEAGDQHVDGRAGDQCTVQIGNNRLHGQRGAPFHEGPVASQTHVVLTGVDQQRGAAAPGLVIGVLDIALEGQRVGQVLFAPDQIDLEDMGPVRPGDAGMVDDLFLAELGPVVPPGNPVTKAVLIQIGR